MTSLRLALVTRRFWPLVGGAEMVMANLAAQFREQGHQSTIVTAQWEPQWPTDVVHREAPVVRLPNPRQRGWGTVRYMMALSRWLRMRAGQLDLVYVSMLKHDAYAATGAAARLNIPVVLRAEGMGPAGDCQWQMDARFGRRIKRRCLTADAVIAPSQAIAEELHAAGYQSQRVHYIPNGVVVPPPRSAARQAAARQALVDVNPDLHVPDRGTVAIYTGRLHIAKGLHELLRAWQPIAQRWPTARLWLVGEGPERDALYQRLVELELQGRVLLPGAFDDVEEVLQAADLFILPSYEEGMSISLLEAMAAGLAIVATDIAGNRMLVVHDEHALLVPPRNVRALSDALHHLLSQPAQGVALGQAARQRVRDQFDLRHMAQRHIELFQHLAASRNVA